MGTNKEKENKILTTNIRGTTRRVGLSSRQGNAHSINTSIAVKTRIYWKSTKSQWKINLRDKSRCQSSIRESKTGS